MSTAKIKWSEAGRIARVIGGKAFEHLMKPHQTKLHDLAVKAYNQLWYNLGAMPHTLVKHGYATEQDYMTIKLYNSHGQYGELELTRNDDAKWIAPAGYHDEAVLTDDELFDELTAILEQYNPLKQNRSDLIDELTAQLDGKTVKQAMTAWPEAADIIAQVKGINHPPMTTPLEQLLARFLPALPAPVGV